MDFQVIGTIEHIEVIASGHGIRNLSRLNKYYGKANWRKMKGFAKVCLANRTVLDAEVHWYEAHGDWKEGNKNQEVFIMKRHFQICVSNVGYEASLETRKVYEVISDAKAESHHQIRIIDESGEDYLYPARCFAPIRIPFETKAKLELLHA